MLHRSNRISPLLLRRSTSTTSATTKPPGDISSVFASLSGKPPTPLPARFETLKQHLLTPHAVALRDSYHSRLLPSLSHELVEIRERSSSVVPYIDFAAVTSGSLAPEQIAEIKKRGVVIVRGVIPQQTALDLKQDAREYIAANSPNVRAFPATNPSVYELYWSPSQVRARANPRLLATQTFLQTLWHASSGTPIASSIPLTYADRLRMRPPGDAGFALGPHIDGGSLERWEDGAYRRNYAHILSGNWERHDAFDATHRPAANMDLYNGAGACDMFRMWQGWLALSDTRPGEGTLRVYPLLKQATAYTILHPLVGDGVTGFPGADMALAQELNDRTHPDLNLDAGGMVSVPRVEPGDYVAWHCDTIHAVESRHAGNTDSSVMYIPAAPLTDRNVAYLLRQREAAVAGGPAPDFPGAGVADGENGFKGAVEWTEVSVGAQGLRAMGMGTRAWSVDGLQGEEERAVVERANKSVFGL